jgi:hypothetical protein
MIALIFLGASSNLEAEVPLSSSVEAVNIMVQMQMGANSFLPITDLSDLRPYVGYEIRSMQIHGSTFNGASNIDIFYNQRPISFSNRLVNFNQYLEVDLISHPIIVEESKMMLRNTAAAEIYDITFRLQRP